MSDRADSFYINFDTGDRVPALYQVHLTMPATYDGFVEIEATSESEAAELALGREFHNVDWTCNSGDNCAVEVWRVECEDPPENVILIERNRRDSGASLDGLFEPNATGDEGGEG